MTLIWLLGQVLFAAGGCDLPLEVNTYFSLWLLNP